MSGNTKEVEKTETSLTSISLMTVFSIIVYTIGAVIIITGILYTFKKIIGVDDSLTYEQLLTNQALIPEFFKNIRDYLICNIFFSSFMIPFVFYFAINDRFKNKSLSRVNIKKYKLIVVALVLLYSLGFGLFYANKYHDILGKYDKNYKIVVENNADVNGYFKQGVDNLSIVPIIHIFSYIVCGIFTIIVVLRRIDFCNKDYAIESGPPMLGIKKV